MSTEHPRTLEEWQAHIEALTDEELWNKAKSANRASFVTKLLQEGYTGEEVESIFQMLAQAFLRIGQTPPASGYFSLSRLAEQK